MKPGNRRSLPGGRKVLIPAECRRQARRHLER